MIKPLLSLLLLLSSFTLAQGYVAKKPFLAGAFCKTYRCTPIKGAWNWDATVYQTRLPMVNVQITGGNIKGGTVDEITFFARNPYKYGFSTYQKALHVMAKQLFQKDIPIPASYHTRCQAFAALDTIYESGKLQLYCMAHLSRDGDLLGVDYVFYYLP